MSQAPTSVDILGMILAFDYTVAWLELQKEGSDEWEWGRAEIWGFCFKHCACLAWKRDQHPITSHQNPHMEAHTWSHQWGDGGRVPEIQDYPQLYSLNHMRPWFLKAGIWKMMQKHKECKIGPYDVSLGKVFHSSTKWRELFSTSYTEESILQLIEFGTMEKQKSHQWHLRRRYNHMFKNKCRNII